MSNMFNSILIVDDEKNAREGLKRYFEQKDYDVSTVEDGHKALEIVKSENPDVALVDLKMPGMDGMTLLQKIKKIRPRTTVIVLTAYGTVETAVQAMKAGAFYYITKPVNLEELDLILKKALREQTLEQENQSLRVELMRERYESGDIIGKSSKIVDLLNVAEQVAQSSATVLIQGESGTGKELLAHAIHRYSQRKNRPFVTIHCAALTESLLTSELFGHERGAFTGATERKIGRFELADGGTLFLDEIGELPESTQIKLLRFLQGGEFERVGSTKTMRVDVRLICATNKDLAREVKAGKFREDLYYRINVILLKTPALRERPEDIPLLVEHFVGHFGRLNNKKIKSITPEAMASLQKYPWPGNIRELRNVIERAIVLSRDTTIGIETMPDDVRSSSDGNAGEDRVMSTQSDLSLIEKTVIEKTLKSCNGNKSVAAKKLGISRRTLYRKLEEYELPV